MSSIHRHNQARAIAGLGIVATLVLGACSSGTTSSEGTSEGASPAGVGAPVKGDAAGGSPGAMPADGSKDASGAKAKAPGATPAQAQKLIRTANIRLSVDNVTSSAASVRAVALSVGGMVTAEDISTNDPLPGGTPSPALDTTPTTNEPAPGRRYDTGTVTLAVPADKLDTVLDQLSKVGSVLQRTSSSQDVTSTYIDTQSRVATMKTSIDRLRALMTQTTGIDQIVRLETELSQREADLEALQATLATLDRQVTMSTVVVGLTSKAAPTNPVASETGFLAGVRSGWKAFTEMFVGVFTVVGAVLPFVAALGVIGVPALIWWRRRPRPARGGHGVVAGFGLGQRAEPGGEQPGGEQPGGEQPSGEQPAVAAPGQSERPATVTPDVPAPRAPHPSETS